MINIKQHLGIFALLISFSILLGCKKNVDNPDDDHEEELITTLKLMFTDKNSIEPSATVIFNDPDGVGGNAPTQFDTIIINDSTTYTVKIELWNEAENPAENLTSEIEEENNEHLFCFDVNTDGLTVNRTDTDGTYEVGLESEWIVTKAGSGTVKVTLKHQPDGTKNGSCNVGDTDVEILFPVVIK